MTGEFNYVIARKWKKTDMDGDPICVYAYGTEVFHGSEKDALYMRGFIRMREKDDSYEIYPIMGEPLKLNHDKDKPSRRTLP